MCNNVPGQERVKQGAKLMSEPQIYTADDVGTSGFCIGVRSATEGMFQALKAPHHRRLAREEVTPICVPMDDFIADALRQLYGVGAAPSNEGYFAVTPKITGCAYDSPGRPDAEPGWARVRLASVDGQVRHTDLCAPSILIAPNGALLFRESDREKVRRVSLRQALELAVEGAQQ